MADRVTASNTLLQSGGGAKERILPDNSKQVCGGALVVHLDRPCIA